MKRSVMTASLLAVALALAPASWLAGQMQPETFSAAEFKAHHVEIREHLDHLDTMAQRLSGESPERRQRTMNFVLGFLTDHILTHAREEETTLYKWADHKAGPRFTESMRYEHKIVERWIDELRDLAREEPSDANAAAFTRRAQRLLGLLEAHFEVEEEVILPAVAQER
jgi:hemerythrin-like domain-containing protein